MKLAIIFLFFAFCNANTLIWNTGFNANATSQSRAETLDLDGPSMIEVFFNASANITKGNITVQSAVISGGYTVDTFQFGFKYSAFSDESVGDSTISYASSFGPCESDWLNSNGSIPLIFTSQAIQYSNVDVLQDTTATIIVVSNSNITYKANSGWQSFRTAKYAAQQYLILTIPEVAENDMFNLTLSLTVSTGVVPISNLVLAAGELCPDQTDAPFQWEIKRGREINILATDLAPGTWYMKLYPTVKDTEFRMSVSAVPSGKGTCSGFTGKCVP